MARSTKKRGLAWSPRDWSNTIIRSHDQEIVRVEHDAGLDRGDRDRLETPASTRAGFQPSLLALPVRRTLVEEGIHPLAEILAHVGAQDQVPAFLARQRAAETEHRFLGGFHRDRGMAGNE